MSLLNFIGGSRRQTTLQRRPEATTAKADISIHAAHLSAPSRQGSLDVALAPAADQAKRKPPSRSQTDSFPYLHPPKTSSQSSLANTDKKPSGWRNLSRIIKSSPAASKTSLLSQDAGSEASSSVPPQSDPGPKHQVLSKADTPPRKASTSLEQGWTELGNDSGDEGEVLDVHQEEASQTTKTLEESVVVVEDHESNARLLKEELTQTRSKLEEVTNERSALKERIQALEEEEKSREHEKRLLEEAADERKAELLRAHARELENKHRETEALQQSLEALRYESRGRSEKMDLLAQENGVLCQEVAGLEERGKKAEMEIGALRYEVQNANDALRGLKDRSRVLLDDSREETRKLTDQVDQLWRQLQDLQNLSEERDQQIQTLRTTEQKSKDEFLRVQATVVEKDRVVDDLLHKNGLLAKKTELLQGRIGEMEMEAVESGNAAQRLLAKTKEGHQQAMADAETRVRALQTEASSYASIAQELRSSFNGKRAEAENATKLVETRGAEIHRLRQQLSTLQKTLSAKDQELIDSAASKASQSHLEDTIRTLRQRISKIEDEQTHNLRQSQLQVTSALNEAKLQTSLVEKELGLAREHLRDLQRRYESSEQTRKMLRDQLVRREEDNRRARAEVSSSSSSLRDAPAPSDEKVYSLLQTLNYQIFQTAALMSDSLCSIHRSPSRSSGEGPTAADLIDPETTSLIGSHLLSLVRSQSTLSMASYNSLPLQAAIQATLVCCASRVMTAWYPGHWDVSDFLSATYLRIRAAEGITASETWKTTTRERLKPTPATVLLIVDFMTDCLTTIFHFAGWSPSAPASPASGSKDQSLETLLQANREKLSVLARLALRLNVLLDAVKPQLEPALVEPSSTFDPRVMEREDAITDDDEDSGVTKDNEVVCTSEIGLRKVIEPVTPGGESREWARKKGIVLKPKVILRSSLEV